MNDLESGDALPAGDAREIATHLYRELRALAAAHLKSERPGHTLQPTALANEVWIKLVATGLADSSDRTAVIHLAARAIRNLLVDHARRRKALKRGRLCERIDIDLASLAGESNSVDLLALEHALEALHALDSRQAQVVELRFFGGLTVPEVARSLSISPATVKRDWELARAFLFRELNSN